MIPAPCRRSCCSSRIPGAPIIALAMAQFLLVTTLLASPLKRDEQVMFVPAPARDLPDGRIELEVHAWVYEHEPRRGSVALFARYLDLNLDAVSPAQHALFEARTQLFRVDSERGKHLRLRIDNGPEVDLPRTSADGRSTVRVTVGATASDDSGRIGFAAITPRGDDREFRGQALRVPAHGLSVISDIDDTIKHSQVTDRRELLLNTFARPFIAVPGMADRYRSLAAEAGTRFHYVSASPMQLYPALADFLDDARFPEGSMHLREMTGWRSLLSGGPDSQTHKRNAIERLLRDFPARHFLLVGDSGEHDPEIYADLARAHPGRIVSIAIRNVTGETAASPRYAHTFEGLERQLWTVFDEAGDWRPTAR